MKIQTGLTTSIIRQKVIKKEVMSKVSPFLNEVTICKFVVALLTHINPEGVEPTSGFRLVIVIPTPGYASLTRGYAHFTPAGVIAYNL